MVVRIDVAVETHRELITQRPSASIATLRVTYLVCL